MIFSTLTPGLARAASGCEDELGAPYGLKRTTALIMGGSDERARVGLEQLRAFVRRARPERREIADHVARLLDQPLSWSDEREADHLRASFLTYVRRSPRLAPDYIEPITAAMFAHFRMEEGFDLADRDFDELENILAWYLAVAAERPKVAAALFRSHLDEHLHAFVFDGVQTLHELLDNPFTDATALIGLMRELARPIVGLDLASLAQSEALDPDSAAIVFWSRLTERVARALPNLANHWVSRAAHKLRGRVLKAEQIAARKLEQKREFERVKAEVRDWHAGTIGADRVTAYRKWVFLGRPPAARYWIILADRAATLGNRDYGGSNDEEESEGASRANRAAEFPVDSPIHRHLVGFAGPNVARVERGSRALPVPPALRALAVDLPDRLYFRSANHYDEHVWERAERHRASPTFFKRRPPEYVVDSFGRLLAAIKDAESSPSAKRIPRTMLDAAAEVLARVKDGLARDNLETTAWSVSKRNEMLESLAVADWQVLEGRASHLSNELLQANVRGTRFNLAVCVREPCSGDLRVGGVASIYPVCGPGVFLVPRTSKIARTIDRLRDPNLKVNKEFRQGLVGAKPCPN